jgi:hypothetical protein
MSAQVQAYQASGALVYRCAARLHRCLWSWERAAAALRHSAVTTLAGPRRRCRCEARARDEILAQKFRKTWRYQACVGRPCCAAPTHGEAPTIPRTWAATHWRRHHHKYQEVRAYSLDCSAWTRASNCARVGSGCVRRSFSSGRIRTCGSNSSLKRHKHLRQSSQIPSTMTVQKVGARHHQAPGHRNCSYPPMRACHLRAPTLYVSSRGSAAGQYRHPSAGHPSRHQTSGCRHGKRGARPLRSVALPRPGLPEHPYILRRCSIRHSSASGHLYGRCRFLGCGRRQVAPVASFLGAKYTVCDVLQINVCSMGTPSFPAC